MNPTSSIRRFLHLLAKLRPGFRDVVLLLLRVTIGWSFFVAGKGKLGNLEGVTDFFGSLGIPAPGFHAGLVGGVEMIGGLLLIAGLGSRIAAVPLAFSMIVAYLTAHREEAFAGVDAFADEAPFAYLVVSLVVLAFGPGRVALDAVVSRPLRSKLGLDQ